MMARDLPALFAFLEERLSVPFDWARGRDCTSFALAAVHVQTGVDLLADIPNWSNLKEALAVADAVGGLAAALDERMARVPAAIARRGDVAALADDHFGVRLMIVEGRTLVGPGATGLERLSRSEMMFAWDAASVRAVPHE